VEGQQYWQVKPRNRLITHYKHVSRRSWRSVDHRGIKQRYYPMRGVGSFDAAARFCSAHDDLRDHLRSRQCMNETVSLADQRRLFQERWGKVCAVLQAA